VIDPGHPSEVSAGNTLQNGLREIEVNWDIAVRLRALLAAEPGLTVLLTREQRDALTRNQERAEFANRHQARLMLRLHCDTGKGTGLTLYYPDAPGTTDGRTGPSPEVIAGSRAAAILLQSELETALGGRLRVNPLRTDRQTAVGGKRGALIGSIFSEVPVVTVEMVYLSNASDAAFIGSEAGAVAMARALATGVRRVLDLPARP